MTPVPKGKFPDECENSYYKEGSMTLWCTLSNKACFCTRQWNPKLCEYVSKLEEG